MEIQEHGKLWEDPEEWLGRNPARAHRSRTGKGRQAAGADEGSGKMAGTLRRQHKHEALPRGDPAAAGPAPGTAAPGHAGWRLEAGGRRTPLGPPVLSCSRGLGPRFLVLVSRRPSRRLL